MADAMRDYRSLQNKQNVNRKASCDCSDLSMSDCWTSESDRWVAGAGAGAGVRLVRRVACRVRAALGRSGVPSAAGRRHLRRPARRASASLTAGRPRCTLRQCITCRHEHDRAGRRPRKSPLVIGAASIARALAITHARRNPRQICPAIGASAAHLARSGWRRDCRCRRGRPTPDASLLRFQTPPGISERRESHHSLHESPRTERIAGPDTVCRRRRRAARVKRQFRRSGAASRPGNVPASAKPASGAPSLYRLYGRPHIAVRD